MKRILLTTLLACLSTPPAAFSGIGDTYYCDMVEQAGYRKDVIQRYQRERFTFRWAETEIVFGKGGYFNEHKLWIEADYDSQEVFYAGSNYSLVTFVEGRFRYTRQSIATKETEDEKGNSEAMFIIANCSKFDD